jgi:hypothetical protein
MGDRLQSVIRPKAAVKGFEVFAPGEGMLDSIALEPMLSIPDCPGLLLAVD